jgi:AcrR family transcriptional regulator
MATAKKKILRRDADATRKQLLKAVGELLTEYGYTKLKVNEIARWTGRDKKLIRHYFTNLSGLQRAYITSRDYWAPFFERFYLDGQATDEQVMQMFTELMQENFKYFWGDAEMQKIILWQISEVNPLMRSISEAREAKGDQLLRLADRHFAGTDVNFRAVVNLLLGGIYYAVLHAKTNQSSVCGIDINVERDWLTLHRTITQVIGWAWEGANRTNPNIKPTNKIMNYEFESLEILAEELANARSGEEPRMEADPQLKNEAKKLQKVMMRHLLNLSSENQLATYLQINLHTLVAICDLLYDPDAAHNPDAEVVIGLLEAVRNHVNPYIPGNLAVPNLLRDRENRGFKAQWSVIELRLKEILTDQELVVLAGLPFVRFAEKERKLQWADFKYLRSYGAGILQLLEGEVVDDETLPHGLIALGYNHSRFTAYYSGLIRTKIEGREDNEMRRILNRERISLQQITLFAGMKYDRYKQPVPDELVKWIDAELTSVTDQAEQVAVLQRLIAEMQVLLSS